MNSPREHFNWVADNSAKARRRQRAFHAQLAVAHQAAIPGGARVLEVGCGTGDLLAALRPSHGVGIDLSPRMIERARAAHGDRRELVFDVAVAEAIAWEETYDHIVLNYLTGYLTDIQAVLARLHEGAEPRTRLHLTSLNTPWNFVLRLGVKFGWVMPQPTSNWLSEADLINLLELAGWEVIKRETQQLLPVHVPLLSVLCNRFLVRLPLLRHLGATIWLTARPRREVALDETPGCSVIVPARNEAGNIRAALERIPTLGRGTEVVFVEGHSRDDTWEVIQREIAAYAGPHEVRALRQPGKGKWDAVRAGFAVARGQVLVIQDGDLTAPPEDLPKFYEALRSGAAEFVNGSRLVYPMEKRAMRFLNLLGNKFFALALSYVLRQPVKDSLCGTKMQIGRAHV